MMIFLAGMVVGAFIVFIYDGYIMLKMLQSYQQLNHGLVSFTTHSIDQVVDLTLRAKGNPTTSLPDDSTDFWKQN